MLGFTIIKQQTNNNPAITSKYRINPNFRANRIKKQFFIEDIQGTQNNYNARKLLTLHTQRASAKAFIISPVYFANVKWHGYPNKLHAKLILLRYF